MCVNRPWWPACRKHSNNACCSIGLSCPRSLVAPARGTAEKTLPAPSASLIQVPAATASQRSRAAALVQQAQVKSEADHARLGFLVLALRGKKVGFETVIKMIDEMVALLKTEQTDDAKKKEYCGAQFDSTDDKKKSLARKASDIATAIASTDESISSAADDISALEAGIAALDKSVAEATALRKGEHEEYKALMAADGAAKELLLFAKNRLNQFYNMLRCRAYPPPRCGEERRGLVGGAAWGGSIGL